MEKKLLEAAINDRDAYEIIESVASQEDFSDYSHAIFQLIGKYYEVDPEATSIDLEILSDRIKEKYPKTAGELLSVVKDLGDTSVPNVLEELVHVKRKALARDLAGVLVNNPDSQKAKDMIREFEHLNEVLVQPPKSADEDIEEVLMGLTDQSNIIRIYPNGLNDRLNGGVFHGNHIVVFARSNCGKTAFSINLTRGLLRDGRKVLYIANEEPSKQVLRRLVSRINNKTTMEINGSIAESIDKARELLGRFYIKDLVPGTFGEIRSLIKEISPDVLIIDQLRNVRIKEDNRVVALEKLAQEARNIGKEMGVVVVSITQAGDSARDKLILDDGDIDYSNTGIPGAADLIIGIGVNDEIRSKGQRILTIVKNKITSNHTSFPVLMDEERSKIISP